MLQGSSAFFCVFICYSALVHNAFLWFCFFLVFFFDELPFLRRFGFFFCFFFRKFCFFSWKPRLQAYITSFSLKWTPHPWSLGVLWKYPQKLAPPFLHTPSYKNTAFSLSHCSLFFVLGYLWPEERQNALFVVFLAQSLSKCDKIFFVVF